MTELLALKPTDRVLEIGTGSGYQTAVLSELCDEVYTIEIIEPLGRQAQQTFEQHGYDNIHCRIADGHQGRLDGAPFDAIIVTCAPEDVPPALVAQLAMGGRLCIPVGPNSETGQVLVLMTKRPDGTMDREDISMVRFVPMTGSEQPRE
jgi:protein-L-isoaspartate(D-aspartate) O-methyltransferase